MTPDRFQAVTEIYPKLRIGVMGDFCLDRYLEIDPARKETSIETGLPVHNVVNVRSQPGGAGTILNNLVALGVGAIYPVGFCGADGEGFELQRALRGKGSCVHLAHFFATDQRRTFTYCKPLVLESGKPPVELSRLDSKNWTPTPPSVVGRLIESFVKLARDVHALILLDQVDVPDTGVVSAQLLEAVAAAIADDASLLVLADSRRGLRGFPPVVFKMNRAELSALTGTQAGGGAQSLEKNASALAQRLGRHVFVTLAEEGIIGAAPTGDVEHLPALATRGEIDVVGAGDAVTANLVAALAAGATLREALELATAAASIVIHQLGTTGTASVAQIRDLMTEKGFIVPVA
jgi:rfaE bifunctional protein kinase chain/domain